MLKHFAVSYVFIKGTVCNSRKKQEKSWIVTGRFPKISSSTRALFISVLDVVGCNHHDGRSFDSFRIPCNIFRHVAHSLAYQCTPLSVVEISCPATAIRVPDIGH